MRKTAISFFAAVALLFAVGLVSCSDSSSSNSSSDSAYEVSPGSGTSPSSNSSSSGSSSPSSSGTASSNTASEMEMAVLSEMNYARTKPREYVTNRLVPQRTNPTVNLGNSSTYQAALEECISQMNAISSLGALSYGQGLYLAAREWVVEQGRGSSVGHDPNLDGRISKYCTWSKMGENIAYGYDSAEAIVIALLVDDGVSSRGHRKNILELDSNHGPYTHAGVAIGSHAGYRIMCCIDYAGGYADK